MKLHLDGIAGYKENQMNRKVLTFVFLHVGHIIMTPVLYTY